MTPAVRAFVLTLLDRIDELEEQVRKLTPQNSSIPPSTVHPHARPEPKPKAKAGKRKRGGQNVTGRRCTSTPSGCSGVGPI